LVTALNVQIPEKGRGVVRLINNIKPDKITIEFRRARGVCLKYVTYRTYSGKINLDKLGAAVGSQQNRILCAEDIKFPPDSGFIRFSSAEFTSRLCTNMALDVIRRCQHSDCLKVGIYDPQAVSTDFLFYALQVCSDVRVVTNESETYYCQLNRAMEELGATAVVTSRTEELGDCNFVVAPLQISEPLPTKETAIVLTNGRPKVQLSGQVYFKYHMRLPNGFSKLNPPELDEEYFCSALYTLENQYELGTILPTACSNDTMSQTVRSMCKCIDGL
jgi:hypothetical protein